MADEKDEDLTRGSDPSSPREPSDERADGAGVPVEANAELSPEPVGDGQPEPVDVPEDDDRAGERSEDTEPADEPALVGARESRRPVRRTPAEGETERKGRATRRRGGDDDAEGRRTGPVTFVNESVSELRKVVWPTAEQMRTYFIVVLVFVVFMITLVSLLDLAFGTALLRLFS